jgi:hypothetical protein
MIVSGLILQALKILILPHVGHRGEGFREALALWLQQQFFEQGAMFGLGTSTMPRGTLLECIDDALIEVSDYKIGHDITLSVWVMR